MHFDDKGPARLLALDTETDVRLAEMAISRAEEDFTRKDFLNGASLAVGRSLSPTLTSLALLGIWRFGRLADEAETRQMPLLDGETSERDLGVAVSRANSYLGSLAGRPE